MEVYELLRLIIEIVVGVVVIFICVPIIKIYNSLLKLKDARNKYSQELIGVKDERIAIYEEKEKLRKEIATAGVDMYTDFNRLEVSEEKRETLKIAFASVPLSNNEYIQQDADVHLSMAKVYSMGREWINAINQFELALPYIPKDWNVMMLYGIACANSRNSDYYLKSVEAYSSAIAYIPDDASLNTKARLYCYRGAIYKRLRRTNEALVDLKYALDIATEDYEISDALYNLACVYAMQDNHKEYNNVVAQLDTNEYDKALEQLGEKLREYAPCFKAKNNIDSE